MSLPHIWHMWHIWPLVAVYALVTICAGPAWAGLIASNPLGGEDAGLPGGEGTITAPTVQQTTWRGLSGASVPAGNAKDDEWFNVVVFDRRPESADYVPSPLLSSNATSRPSVVASKLEPNRYSSVLDDWTTPLLRVSLDEMRSKQSSTPVNLIVPDHTQPLPAPVGE